MNQVITYLLTTLFLAFLLRVSLRTVPAATKGGSVVLRYPAHFRWLVAVSACLFAALGVAIAGDLRAPGDRLKWSIMGVCLLVVVGYSILEFFGVRLLVDESGIISLSPWTGKRVLAWSEVAEVSFSSWAMWFVIRPKTGAPIRAHAYLGGVRYLCAALRRRLPPAALQPAADGFRIVGA